MACEFCKDLDLRGKEQGFVVKYSELNHTCRFCMILCSLVHRFEPEVENQKFNTSLQIDQQEFKALDIGLTVTDPTQGNEIPQLSKSFWLYYSKSANSICDLPSFRGLGDISFRSDSDECFQFVESKVRHCLESHPNCKQNSHAPLPKRVLHIGDKPGDPIRLVEPGSQCIPYISLSHCWGGHQPIRTVTENIDQMKAYIPWEDLSRVFQDAINVSRRLRVEWIWIDSLCIIQDSKEDWEIESSKMCNYYENAYLTISASSSQDGTFPFLQARGDYWRPQRFDFKCADGTMAEILARRHEGSSMVQVIEELSPLASRGWVWQENVLSTRILHYTQSQLIWECRTEVCSEDGGIPRGFYSMGLSQKLLYANVSPYESWHSLLESYSVRKLTFESDRLPAVSGVASKIQEKTGSEYLAGLWMGNMPVELCWCLDYVSSDANPEFLPEKYIAPSWSWASVRGVVNFTDQNSAHVFESSVDVVDARCSVPGLNKYGEVTGGYMVLRGPVVPITVNCHTPLNCWAYTVSDGHDNFEPMAPDSLLVACQVNGQQQLRRAKPGDALDPFSIQLQCVRIGKQEDADDENTLMIFGMIVALNEGALNEGGLATFTRVGMIQVDSEVWFEGSNETTIRVI